MNRIAEVAANHVAEPRDVLDLHGLVQSVVSGHEPWQDNTFRFQLQGLPDGRTKLRFWQVYAVELEDDYYGVYNYNWGYYLESQRLLCATGVGKPFEVPA